MDANEIVCALLLAGLTQEQIADQSGVHQTTVSKIARGDTKNVLYSTHQALQCLHSNITAKQAALSKTTTTEGV